jgi:hypothetical protein
MNSQSGFMSRISPRLTEAKRAAIRESVASGGALNGSYLAMNLAAALRFWPHGELSSCHHRRDVDRDAVWSDRWHRSRDGRGEPVPAGPLPCVGTRWCCIRPGRPSSLGSVEAHPLGSIIDAATTEMRGRSPKPGPRLPITNLCTTAGAEMMAPCFCNIARWIWRWAGRCAIRIHLLK